MNKLSDLLMPIGVIGLAVASFASGAQLKALQRRVEGLEQASPTRGNERGSYGKASR